MNGDRCVLCEIRAETGAQGRRILLVEDEALIALNEATILRRDGYEVLTVHTGENAIAAVEADPSIDLILMDIDLGRGIDGTQAAEHILRLRRVPIVFLTSHCEAEMVARVKGITRYGYVLKSSGEFVLRQVIAGAFELYEAHQAHKLLFDHALSGLCIYEMICDEAGHLVDARHLEVNRAFMRHTGLSREQVLGRTLREVYGDTGGVRALLNVYIHALEEPTDAPREHYFEGTTRWIALNAYHSGPGRFSVVLRDITKEKRGARQPLFSEAGPTFTSSSRAQKAPRLGTAQGRD